MVNKEVTAKIRSKTAKIGVIGMGYVGLPLAMAFVRGGYAVTGLDNDTKRVSQLNKGVSYIQDVPSANLKDALKRRSFKATSDYKVLHSQDVIIICVPTPLSKTKQPDISYVVAATQNIAKHLRRGQLIVLESTTYPGTTEEVMLPILLESGLKAEKDFFLAFSPERVDPGNKKFSTVNIPKVVGGIGPVSTDAVKQLYASVIDTVVPVSSAKAAEMVKLLENTFRSVNIALINEMALLCNALGVDIWEVIHAAKTKPFGFMPFYPGPGIGGHCLPIDPLYLSWKSRKHGYEARLIELASQVNEHMPRHVVERTTLLLNERRIAVKKSPILILGVAYKKDVNDYRESPALEIITEFLGEGASVSYSDPWVPAIHTPEFSMKSQKLTPALLKKQACIVLVTDHSSFDYRMVVKNSKLIFDTRNALRVFHNQQNLFFL